MPQTEFKRNDENETFDEKIHKEITEFLTKKRKAIIYELARNKKLSHGELADAVGTSVASLSNILIRFEQFRYKLIDSITSGKYRYYFLTELGKTYVKIWHEDEKKNESKTVIQHEAVRLMQEAKECLEMFQRVYEDDWEMQLDDALIMRMNYYGVLEGESKILVDKFLEDIEKILLSEDETFIDKILKLLSNNAILQGRLAQFMDKFAPFAFLLTALKEEENTLQIYELLEAVIEKNLIVARTCSEKLGWSDEYDKISVAICEIVDHVKGKSTQNIYECFCQYLAGNKALSAFLASVTRRTFERKAI